MKSIDRFVRLDCALIKAGHGLGKGTTGNKKAQPKKGRHNGKKGWHNGNSARFCPELGRFRVKMGVKCRCAAENPVVPFLRRLCQCFSPLCLFSGGRANAIFRCALSRAAVPPGCSVEPPLWLRVREKCICFQGHT